MIEVLEAINRHEARSTFQVKNSTRSYPRLEVDTTTNAAVAQAGGVMLTDTIANTGLAEHLRATLAPCRKDQAIHDPSKVLLDLALAVALGGDHLSDVAVRGSTPSPPPS